MTCPLYRQRAGCPLSQSVSVHKILGRAKIEITVRTKSGGSSGCREFQRPPFAPDEFSPCTEDTEKTKGTAVVASLSSLPLIRGSGLCLGYTPPPYGHLPYLVEQFWGYFLLGFRPEAGRLRTRQCQKKAHVKGQATETNNESPGAFAPIPENHSLLLPRQRHRQLSYTRA